MPIKKSELYSSLWESCDELLGGMNASQYEDYVPILLFVKYVSDNALEARLDKIGALKQGMMQERLTGRIRLVNRGGSNDSSNC